MASASAGLELPATILIAPLLGCIAGSCREAPLPRALITRRRQGWQYDGQAGPGFVPVDSDDAGVGPRTRYAPLPNQTPSLPGFGHASDLLEPDTPAAGRGIPVPNLCPAGGRGHADSRNRRSSGSAMALMWRPYSGSLRWVQRRELLLRLASAQVHW